MYLPINKEDIPYRFEVELRGEIFEFEIHYNAEHDFFTIDIFKNNEVLAHGEKLVYGQTLFSGIADTRFPKVDIIPRDESGNETMITFDNFCKTVFLEVIE